MIQKVKQDNKIFLSDDSMTINNLNLTGSTISRSTKRKEIMDRILLNYGLQLKGNEIVTDATEQSFVQKKFCFISAISEINDMYNEFTPKSFGLAYTAQVKRKGSEIIIHNPNVEICKYRPDITNKELNKIKKQEAR